MDNVHIAIAQPDQLNAVYSLMALAGEHMHRVLGLSHWHPFPSSESFISRIEEHEVYLVYKDDVVVGTFNISEMSELYYTVDMRDYWEDTSAKALYFSGFAILPAFQQQGIGSWVMSQVDAIAKERGYPYLRFDGVASHPKLIDFYTRLGYRQCGELMVREPIAVMCFEKAF